MPLSEPFHGLGPAGEALLGIGGQDMPVTYDEVREAMDAYAHELAEKIRQRAKHDVLKNCVPCAVHRSDADLIDPEVE